MLRANEIMKLAADIASWWYTKRRWWHLATLCTILLYVYLFVANAWVVDESYITFRTIDNFLHGYGLTWNVGERVQGYTHPMWMFMVAGGAFFSSEFHFTVIAVSLLCSLGVLAFSGWFFSPGASRGQVVQGWKMPLFVLLLCSSKAYIDFSTSGLENPLSHLLAALFVVRLLQLLEREGPLSESNLLGLYLIASISGFNRLDTVLLYAPSLLYCSVISMRSLRFRLLRVAVVGTLPVTLWMLFSIVYYGFPFPNTYYAKLAASGANSSAMLRFGLDSFRNSWSWDLVTQLTIVVGIVASVVREQQNGGSRVRMPPLMLVVGMVLYLAYVLFNAASATHMSGRFFSVPFVIAALVTVHALDSRQLAVVLVAVAAFFGATSDRASIKFGTKHYAKGFDAPSVIDTKLAVYEEGAALINYKPGVVFPNHEWYDAGLRFRASDKKVMVYSTPGYFGYAAGPDKWVIDGMGLCDPLLGRMPGSPHPNRKGGHYIRELPEGYLETFIKPGTQLSDPSLQQYFDIIVSITRGPVFRWQRFQHIWEMNLGRHQHLLNEYLSRKRSG